jgi:hypothetical protein
VPQWLPLLYDGEIVPYRLLPDGFKAYDFNLELLPDNRIRITPNRPIYKESHVYIIGVRDTIAPSAPTMLNIPRFIDDFNYTLSWNEPHDNFGTLGYILKFNGATVDTVYAPVFSIVNDSTFNCSVAQWEIFPFDNSWNIGLPASVSLYPSDPLPGNEVIITTQPVSVFTEPGQAAIFSVQATNAVDYEWQVSDDGVQWHTYTRSDDDSLTIDIVDTTLHGKYFRVIAKTYCGINDTSDAVQFNVVSSVPVRQPALTASIIPNPNNGNFQLYVNQLSSDIEVAMADVTGKTIYSATIPYSAPSISYHIISLLKIIRQGFMWCNCGRERLAIR